MSSPDVFQNGTFLFVRKGQSPPAVAYWRNTGRYWQEGTAIGSRTTQGRGSHKVYKNGRPEESAIAARTAKRELSALANRLERADTGTNTKFVNMRTHFIPVRRPNEAAPAGAPPVPAPANNETMAGLSDALRTLGMSGKGRRKTRRRRATRRRRTHRK